MAKIDGIQELLKKGLIKYGNSPELVVERLALGIPALDNLLGGGVPIGKCIQAYGPESTGKTLFAQILAAAVQKSQYPNVLYMDLEYSYDKEWWAESGVDTSKLMVSSPTTAEQAIDVMRGCLSSMDDLGLIITDSLTGMIPSPEMDEEKSSEDSRAPGAQAKILTLMYHQVVPLLKRRTIFYSINQMRDNIGGHDELAPLPGGKANRHYNHIILRTRRDSWILDGKNRIGFYMEFVNRKNKTAKTADGESVMLPFMFSSQIDWVTSYLEDGIRFGFVKRNGPYYYWKDKPYLGMPKLRNWFIDNQDELNELKGMIGLEIS